MGGGREHRVCAIMVKLTLHAPRIAMNSHVEAMTRACCTWKSRAVRVLQPPASFPYCPRRGTMQGLQTVRCASMRLKREGKFTVASSPRSCRSSICLIGRRVPLVISLALACCPTRGQGLMPSEAVSCRKQSRKRLRNWRQSWKFPQEEVYMD
jgi:hypothetical protein